MLKKLGYWYLPTIVSRALGVFVLPIYTLFLLPVDYGYYELILLFLNILTYVFAFGWESAFIRYYNDSSNEKEDVLTGIIFYRFIIHILAIVSYFFLRPYVPGLLNILPQFSFLLDLIVITFILKDYFNLLLLYLSSHSYCKQFAFYNVAISLAGLPVSIGLLYKGFGLSSLIYGSLTSSLLGFIFFLYFFIHKRLFFHFRFGFQKIRNFFYFGLPLVPAAISLAVMQYSDRFFISEFLTIDDVGLYSFALKVTSLFLILTLAFNLLWGPFIYRHYRKKEAPILFANVFSLYSVFLFLGAIFLSLFAKDIFLLLASSSDFLAYFYLVPFLILSYFIYNVGDYFCVGIGIKEKTIYKTYSSIFAALLNLFLNYIFIIKFGVLGVILATIISCIVYLSCLMYNSQKLFPVPYNFTLFLILCGGILSTFLVISAPLSYRVLLFLTATVIVFSKRKYFLHLMKEIQNIIYQ